MNKINYRDNSIKDIDRAAEAQDEKIERKDYDDRRREDRIDSLVRRLVT